MISNEIDRLKNEINKLENQQNRCTHNFAEAVYNPETVSEPIYSDRMRHWDLGYEVVGYQDKTKPRWSRKCTKCGYVQHTYKTEPIVVGTKPKF